MFGTIADRPVNGAQRIDGIRSTRTAATTRTHVISYPRQLVFMSSRTHVNSYPGPLAPRTTRTPYVRIYFTSVLPRILKVK